MPTCDSPSDLCHECQPIYLKVATGELAKVELFPRVHVYPLLLVKNIDDPDMSRKFRGDLLDRMAHHIINEMGRYYGSDVPGYMCKTGWGVAILIYLPRDEKITSEFLAGFLGNAPGGSQGWNVVSSRQWRSDGGCLTAMRLKFFDCMLHGYHAPHFEDVEIVDERSDRGSAVSSASSSRSSRYSRSSRHGHDDASMVSSRSSTSRTLRR